MKKLIGSLAFFALLISCTTDIEPLDPSLNPNGSNPGNGNPNTNAVFTATVNGTAYVGSIVEATLNSDGLIIESEQGNLSLGFQVFDPVVGTFNVDTASSMTGALLVYANEPSNLAWIASTGEVVITEIDMTNQTVTGTFQGLAQEIFGSDTDRAITNGVFQNIPYTTDEGSDMATADVNGMPFVADLFPIGEINNRQTIVFDSGLDERIAISVPSNITAGTYPIENFSGGTYSGYYENDSVNMGAQHDSVAGTGSIVITDRTGDVITGTFDFTATDPNNPSSTFTITNGQFVVEML
ncbi:hypothetical protein LX97_02795 [Nonlabens dokdonensis]|jgi:hypothetical protein|uniref:Lipoprotein n=2 Tax=Nonlabens dokdonensis TaxID=328515 RepID=L7W9W2_NONDD|nr:DUF6252 family protein [Nonlabens dokdonensis]AGC78470.1 hypothetical protein DDD_3343 [Nonlabens dokdonensis DSW-6]PZX38214.1 hypothetical protein LX97_02795 [Nonlabens dokdonensis]